MLTPDEVAALAAHTDRIAAGELDHIPDTSIQLEPVFRRGEKAVTDQVLAVRKLYSIAVYDDVMWAHVTHPKIADIAADLLGTDDIKMYGDQLFMKAPRTGTAQGWHQDSASWRDIFPMDLVSAWTAIDAATLDNGCLKLRPGHPSLGHVAGRALGPFCRRPKKRRVAHPTRSPPPRQHQLPPQLDASSEQRQSHRYAAQGLCRALHARDFLARRGGHRRAQDAPL